MGCPSGRNRHLWMCFGAIASSCLMPTRVRMNASQPMPALQLTTSERRVAIRRDFHRHAEPGWCESLTAGNVIGLGVARVLAQAKNNIRGHVRLLFQPAEEGLRGAAAMIAAGALDDVDLFMGAHLGVQAGKLGEIIPGYRKILASVKIDATF